jgi:hypothetical protein
MFDRADLSFAGELDFPNCADDLRVEPGGHLAALSPGTCSVHDLLVEEPEVVEEWIDTWDQDSGDEWGCDPISVVDLDAGTHLGNTPGFGPAEWAPGGRYVVGFTTEDTLMAEWNLFTLEPFGVVVVDTDDMSFDLFDLGLARPDFVFGPDGETLYVTSRDGEAVEFTARIDLETGALANLPGPAVSLDERAVVPSASDRLFAAEGGALFALDAESGVTPLALGSGVTGDRLHVRPQGDLLVFTDLESGAHHLVDPATGALAGSPGAP